MTSTPRTPDRPQAGSTFDWARAQRAELDWWKTWHKDGQAVPGEGGLHRYPVYQTVFGPHLSRDSILDVGGGPFPFVAFMPACKRKASLDPLNSSYRKSGFPKADDVEYWDGEAESLPFRNGEFDQVLLLNMLDHLADWELALREAMRVARSSVLVHVHLDGPFADDGMHRILPESETCAVMERSFHGQRLTLTYPVDTRSLARRLLWGLKRRLQGQRFCLRLPVEKCWAGIVRVPPGSD